MTKLNCINLKTEQFRTQETMNRTDRKLNRKQFCCLKCINNFLILDIYKGFRSNVIYFFNSLTALLLALPRNRLSDLALLSDHSCLDLKRVSTGPTGGPIFTHQRPVNPEPEAKAVTGRSDLSNFRKLIKGLTECGSLEKGMANHSVFLP